MIAMKQVWWDQMWDAAEDAIQRWMLARHWKRSSRTGCWHLNRRQPAGRDALIEQHGDRYLLRVANQPEHHCSMSDTWHDSLQLAMEAERGEP